MENCVASIRRFIVACGRVNSTSLCQSSRFGKSIAGRVERDDQPLQFDGDVARV
jgi:hypothetical protein